MRSSRSAVAALAATAVLIAGCASTIAGTAVPNAAAVSLGNSSQDSPAPTSESTPPGITTPSQSPSSQSPSSQSPTGESSTSESTPESTSGTDSSPTPGTGTTPTGSSGPQTSGTPQTYPTAPLQYNKTSSTQRGANLLEARRIAGALVVPTFIDGSFDRGGDLSTLPLGGPANLTILFASSSPVPSVAQRAGMITGFSSARSDDADDGLVVAAFEFGTAAQAKAAVPPLAAAAADKTTDKGKAVVAGYPTSAGWYGTISGGGLYFQTFQAQGRMVLYTYIGGKRFTSPAVAAALAAKVLQALAASMVKFVPTAPTAIMSLPVDPYGMLAHTLPNVGDNATVLDGAISAAGQLHYDSDPAGTKVVFSTAGVDQVADGRASVYRAATATGAALVRDDFVAFVQKTQSGMQPFTLTVDVPTAKCLQQALNSVYYCVGTQGRYAFEVSAKSESDLNAAMTAQYQLLTGF